MTRRWCIALFLMFLAVPTLGADKPTQEQIRQAIKDLGDRHFAVREKASRFLWQAGTDAELPLREALKSNDAETIRRAKLLLDKFEWGIFPDTPPKVIEQIDAFREADKGTRLTIVTKLMNLGKPGYSALKCLIEKESVASDRLDILRQISHDAQRLLPRLLAADDVPAVEDLLNRCRLADTEEAYANYAAWAALNQRLPESIQHWEKQWQQTQDKSDGQTLVYLLQASGELARAQQVAARINDLPLFEQLLCEASNWKELSAIYKRDKIEPRDITKLGKHAIAHRYAGDQQAFEAAIAQLRQVADSEDRFELISAVQALLLIGRHQDTLEMLRKRNVAAALTFDILFIRGQYKEALALADQRPTAPDERFHFDLRHAWGLWLLGEQKAASETFDRLSESLKEIDQLSAGCDLIRALVELQQRDRAAAVAERYLTQLLKQDVREGLVDVLEPLFGDDAAIALTVWLHAHRKQQSKESGSIMATVQRLMQGSPVPDLDRWCSELEQAKPDVAAPLLDQEQSLRVPPVLAAAVLQAKAKKASKALEYFKTAADQCTAAEIPRRCGDFLFKLNRFQEAASWYERATKIAPGDPLIVFLHGASLEKAGDTKEGARLRELAHRMPLGNDVDRVLLAENLERRGFTEDAHREHSLILNMGWYRSPLIGNVMLATARNAMRSGDYSRAVSLVQQAIVGGLRSGATMVYPAAYLTIPQQVNRAQALDQIKKGRFDEALATIRASLDALPNDIDLLTDVVPALDRAGQKSAADSLVNDTLLRYEKICREYPDSAFAHNALAWLAACTNRQLDQALAHAERAAALEPAIASYLDTLAEVHFRRGDAQKAIEIIQRCQKLDPDRLYFARQLARFTKGDRSVPPPEDDH